MGDLGRIRAAKEVLAVIIDRDGPELLPLYERLEQEEREALQSSSALDRALKLARERTRRAA